MLNYYTLAVLGEQVPLKLKIKNTRKIVQKTEEDFEYVQYNPRKNIPRKGLSITSLDGGLSGIPDLDSLKEYNIENGTTLKETDFNVKTPVYELFKDVLYIFDEWLYRSHILKLEPGGFFPPHRDVWGEMNSFRIIIPLFNSSAPRTAFTVDDKVLQWEEGRLYFLDTAKSHSLVNMREEPSYWVVLNLKSEDAAIRKVLEYLYVS